MTRHRREAVEWFLWATAATLIGLIAVAARGQVVCVGPNCNRGRQAAPVQSDPPPRLSWDEGQPVHIDNRGRFPLIRMAAKGNKSRKTRIQSITPTFWAICCEMPAGDCSGPVFGIPNGRGGWMSVGRIVSARRPA